MWASELFSGLEWMAFREPKKLFRLNILYYATIHI